jgi:hypothetical protein
MNRHRHAPVGHLLLLSGALGLAGCESKLADLSDTELQDRIYECRSTTSQSPGFAITCDNFQRECERRRDQGRFVC